MSKKLKKGLWLKASSISTESTLYVYYENTNGSGQLTSILGLIIGKENNQVNIFDYTLGTKGIDNISPRIIPIIIAKLQDLNEFHHTQLIRKLKERYEETQGLKLPEQNSDSEELPRKIQKLNKSLEFRILKHNREVARRKNGI